MTKWIFSPQDHEKSHYFEPVEKRFSIRQIAYLNVEGVGINGTFFIKGSVASHGSNIYVTAMGFTSAMELPEHRNAFTFYGSARLLKEGQVVSSKKLSQNGKELWPDNGYAPIGSAFFVPSPARDPKAYSILVEASYWFTSWAGTVTPMPRKAETTIQLIGR